MGKLTYKDAGVDTKEGERAVSLMKEHVKKTFNAHRAGQLWRTVQTPCRRNEGACACQRYRRRRYKAADSIYDG